MPMGDAALLRRSRDLRHILNYEWLSDILVALRAGPLHYSELLDRVQKDAPFDLWAARKPIIQPRVLGRTLVTMVDNGLLVRHEEANSFPRSVSYELTDAAQELLPRLAVLASWAVRHDEMITVARARHLRSRGLDPDDADVDPGVCG